MMTANASWICARRAFGSVFRGTKRADLPAYAPHQYEFYRDGCSRYTLGSHP